MTTHPMRQSATEYLALEVSQRLPLFGLKRGDRVAVTSKSSYSNGEVVLLLDKSSERQYVAAHLKTANNKMLFMFSDQKLYLTDSDNTEILGAIVNCANLRVGVFKTP